MIRGLFHNLIIFHIISHIPQKHLWEVSFKMLLEFKWSTWMFWFYWRGFRVGGWGKKIYGIEEGGCAEVSRGCESPFSKQKTPISLQIQYNLSYRKNPSLHSFAQKVLMLTSSSFLIQSASPPSHALGHHLFFFAVDCATSSTTAPSFPKRSMSTCHRRGRRLRSVIS